MTIKTILAKDQNNVLVQADARVILEIIAGATGLPLVSQTGFVGPYLYSNATDLEISAGPKLLTFVSHTINLDSDGNLSITRENQGPTAPFLDLTAGLLKTLKGFASGGYTRKIFTDAADVNAALSAAGANSPAAVTIINTGVLELESALSVPDEGNVIIEGLGPGTVLKAAAGANTDLIHSACVGTDAAHYFGAWEAVPRPSGGHFTLRDLTLDGNRAANAAAVSDPSLTITVTGWEITANVVTLRLATTAAFSWTPLPGYNLPIQVAGLAAGAFLNGNHSASSGATPATGNTVQFALAHADVALTTEAGTVRPGPDLANPYGPFANLYYLLGVNLHGLDGVTISNVVSRNMPGYTYSFFDCKNGSVSDCTLYGNIPNVSDDAFHLNGGCLDWTFNNVRFHNFRDDLIACNWEEGSRAAGGRVTITNLTAENCCQGIRVYGDTTECSQVLVSNLVGDFSIQVFSLGFAHHAFAGDAEINHDFTINGARVKLTDPGALVGLVHGSVGTISLTSLTVHDPLYANAILSVGGTIQTTVGSISLTNLEVHFRTGFQGAVYGGTIANARVGTLTIANVRYTTQTLGAMPTVAKFFDVGDGGGVEVLYLGEFNLPNVTAFYTLSGTGFVRRHVGQSWRTGIPITDTQAGPGTTFLAKDHANALAYKGTDNVVKTFLTAVSEPKVEVDNLYAFFHGRDRSDSSGNEHNLVDVGTGAGLTFVNLKFGGGFKFDGTINSQLKFAAYGNGAQASDGFLNQADATSPWELWGWFRPANVTDVATLITDGDAVNLQLTLYQQGADLKAFGIGTFGAQTVTQAGVLVANTPIFFDLRFTGTTLELDVNNSGTPQAIALDRILSVGPSFWLSGDGRELSTVWSNGAMAELGFKRRGLLTPARRTTIFASTASPF
jgi:hypothetical protein